MNSTKPNLMHRLRRFRNAHWPRYVFIHINKTAGSSIERALALRFEHKTAMEKRAELGEQRWNRAYKFSFVRNPWDRVVSHYYYRVKTNQTGLGDRHIDFNTWVELAYRQRDPKYYDQPKMFQPQTAWLQDIDGHLLVDFVGRFENLAADFDQICRRINLKASLLHHKRSEHRHYQNEYSDMTREIVANHFSPDIRAFNYSF